MGLVLLFALILKMENKSGRIANPFKGNIIILVKNKLELTGTYTVKQHKIEVEKELLERNYDIETIKIWLEYID
jgi:hypothetical protein